MEMHAINTRLRITLSDLPPRARPLDAAQLKDVFGGCSHHLEGCRGNFDCCSGSCIDAGPNRLGRCYGS